MTEQIALRIVRGTPEDEEIAALVVALNMVRARAAAEPASRVVRRAGWSREDHWSLAAGHASPGMWAVGGGRPLAEDRPATAEGVGRR
ncbi:acyl-CoA carboxylase subunit epsilon [Spirillospora sp. CA-255316]